MAWMLAITSHTREEELLQVIEDQAKKIESQQKIIEQQQKEIAQLKQFVENLHHQLFVLKRH